MPDRLLFKGRVVFYVHVACFANVPIDFPLVISGRMRGNVMVSCFMKSSHIRMG